MQCFPCQICIFKTEPNLPFAIKSGLWVQPHISFYPAEDNNLHYNHNYNKIVKSDWLSTALISALIG